MEPKLIVLDVDGTLLTSDNRILRSTRRVLASAAERGHQIVLASGRFPGGILPILADLDLEDSVYIALNGALVARGEEVLHEETCPLEPLERAVAEARDLHLSVNVYSGMRWEVMDWRDEVAREAQEVGCQPELVDALTLEGAHKVMIIAEPEDAAAYASWVRHNVEGLHASTSLPWLTEVVKHGVSKASALSWVASYLDIPMHNTIVVGDGENDAEMMEMAGISVAMGNASAEVKQRARFVTTSNDQGGVGWALAQILRLRQIHPDRSHEKE